MDLSRTQHPVKTPNYQSFPTPVPVEPEEAITLASADPRVMAGYLIVQAIEWIGVPDK